MSLRRPAAALVTLILGMAAIAPAEQPRIAVHEMNPWTHLEINDDPDNFQFAIVTDRTGGHRPGVFPDAVRKLNLLQPEFVMTVGDQIEGYTEDRVVLDAEWAEFVGFVGQLEMPYFFVPGNHDISNQVMAQVWKERFGPAYYHFAYRDVLFLCLNSEDTAPTTIGAEQLEYARNALAENPDVRWTFVFLHKPLWNYTDMETGELVDTGWAQVEEMLADRPHTVFAGHYHTYTLHRRQGRDYFVLATTGGGSSLSGPLFGQFDHVVWVTMTDQGPRVANLMLEGIWDKNVRTVELAQLVDGIIRGRAVSVSAILVEGKKFKGGSTQVRLTNDADFPLHISGAFADDALLSVEPTSVDVLVPPNSVELIDVEVSAGRGARLDQLQPVAFLWSAEYDQDRYEIPAVDGQTSLVVSRMYQADRRRDALTVDGDLGDWKDLPYEVTQPAQIDVAADSWQGPADCSWRFGVVEGPEYLYIGVEVTDERAVYKSAVAWSQDGIEVRLDARPDPVRSAGRGDEENLVFIAISPAPKGQDQLLYQPETLEQQGVLAISRPTEKGHNYEMAIPLSYFEERQGADWQRFRLNIAVDDFDEVTGPLAQLWWQPDWRDNTNFAGSGTFERRQ